MGAEIQKQTIYDADFGGSLAVSGQPVWLKSIRKQAFKFFTENGFPTPRNEEWKYTNTAPIAKQEFSFETGKVETEVVKNFTYDESAQNTLVFIDGIFAQEFSRVDGQFSAVTLNAAFKDEELVKVVEAKLGKAADFKKNGFAALNSAFLDEGFLLHVPQNTQVKEPIHLLFISTGGKISFPRVLVAAEKGSDVLLIESFVSAGPGPAFTNAVTEIFVEDNARVTHHRIQKENAESFHIGTTQAVLARDSYYDSTNINFGAALSRHDTGMVFTAEGAECFIDGLYMLNGSQHADTHSIIDHAVPHCTSHQTYKGVLGDRSHAVFNGKVFVGENARGTNAEQSNKNLLLSNEARIDTKPQLEIFNDDVKCAHGATVGQLEDEEVFYLLSRGLHRDLARNLLTYGFAEEVINKIEIGSIKEELDEAVLNRLEATLEV
ncbi:MAG TPA: Fe-S cluster assembly protein SufD [Pyrinomonadaceae bacterium]|jgi:Fe-S cluster assembly protein SufD|nr:Fe-S cluster assembly protein SufD [Pyrinomonadaceae bacterium]